jgi:hypothetical protein
MKLPIPTMDAAYVKPGQNKFLLRKINVVIVISALLAMKRDRHIICDTVLICFFAYTHIYFPINCSRTNLTSFIKR